MLRLWLIGWITASLWTVGIRADHHGSMGSERGGIQAALLYNFLRFVDWPAVALGEDEPLLVGVLDPQSIAPAFADLAREPIRSHPVQLVPVSSLAAAEGVHLLFLNTSDRATVERYIAHVADKPVLTVTELRGGIRHGAMINLFEVRNRYRFEIHLSPAKAANLVIRSPLLRLSRVYEDGEMIRGIE